MTQVRAMNESPVSPKSSAKEISGKKFVGWFLIGSLIFSAIVLGLFRFYFFDVLKEYHDKHPPAPRSADRG